MHVLLLLSLLIDDHSMLLRAGRLSSFLVKPFLMVLTSAMSLLLQVLERRLAYLDYSALVMVRLMMHTLIGITLRGNCITLLLSDLQRGCHLVVAVPLLLCYAACGLTLVTLTY